VQDEQSLKLLQTISINHCSISGDTRFDRVKEIANNFSEIPFIKEFIQDKPVMIAGSTWPDDEKLLAAYASERPDVKFIIAPHEISAAHILTIKALFPSAILYSELKKQQSLPAFKDSQILIIDSIGLLSRLYHYATITYVGGGFTRDGIHNILEAAVYGKPVIFGGNYKKYREGIELVQQGGAFSIPDGPELKKIADDLLNNKEHLQSVENMSRKYVLDNTGATEKIIQLIQEKRLLTN
jgi:3-deoxy-D-manno-octulosonic-acid transferase